MKTLQKKLREAMRKYEWLEEYGELCHDTPIMALFVTMYALMGIGLLSGAAVLLLVAATIPTLVGIGVAGVLGVLIRLLGKAYRE